MLTIPITTWRASWRRVPISRPAGTPNSNGDVLPAGIDLVSAAQRGGITREALLEAIRLLSQVPISSAYLYAQTQTQLERHEWGP